MEPGNRFYEGDEMAVDHSTSESHADNMDVHVRDYSKFTALFKWGAILSFIIAMIVLVLISN
jgi:hypothetical protein